MRAKLVELNPGVPDEAYDDAVRQIVTTIATQLLAATNREKDRVTIEKTFETLLQFMNKFTVLFGAGDEKR